jgi:membrane protein required for beta-lactamase induction
MIWWFLILGVSTLVVVCVAIALFMRLRRHLRPTHAGQDGVATEGDGGHHSGTIED